MRITSSERSFRLCAFSVFSARIWRAIPFRKDQRGDGTRPSRHSFQPVQAVGSPEAAVWRRNRDHRIEEAPDFSITPDKRLWWASERSLKGRGLNAVDHGHKQWVPAKWSR
jgi:hypothetical protein